VAERSSRSEMPARTGRSRSSCTPGGRTRYCGNPGFNRFWRTQTIAGRTRGRPAGCIYDFSLSMSSNLVLCRAHWCRIVTSLCEDIRSFVTGGRGCSTVTSSPTHNTSSGATVSSEGHSCSSSGTSTILTHHEDNINEMLSRASEGSSALDEALLYLVRQK
jgi:hypothetical protein